VTEAAVGAGLVLFRLVADNASMARAMFVAVHLLNTFLLLGALTLTAWWVTGATCRLPGTAPGRRQRWWAAAFALLIAGASGAVGGARRHALSVQPVDRCAVGRPFRDLALPDPAADSSPDARRGGGSRGVDLCRPGRRGRSGRRTAGCADGLYPVLAQVALGLLNVILLAPVWLQLTHLLVADAIWMASCCWAPRH
jgi:heme A synthase